MKDDSRTYQKRKKTLPLEGRGEITFDNALPYGKRNS